MPNKAQTQIDLIGTAEAAALRGVSVKTVTRWVRDGKLTPVQKLPGLRGAYVFDRSDVEALLKQEVA